MDYIELLKHYQSDLSDNTNLIDEAIISLEQHFSLLDKEILIHHSRPLAIAYLALKSIENNR